MALNRQLSGLLAMLVAVSPPLTFSQTAIASPPQLAQITPNTVTDQLDETSDTLDDGSYYNIHSFEGNAGETIRIDMASEEFDTYLILVGPDGQVVGEDDDASEGTNSSLVVTLQETGTYRIVANARSAGVLGRYTLNLETVDVTSDAASDDLQQAYMLYQQASELYDSARFDEAELILQEILPIFRSRLGNSQGYFILKMRLSVSRPYLQQRSA